MKQFGIFLLGALKMLVIMALLILCINAIAVGPEFIRVLGVISLAAVVHYVYKLFKNTRDN